MTHEQDNESRSTREQLHVRAVLQTVRHLARAESASGEGVYEEEETVQTRAESASGEGVYEEEETVQTRAESAPGEGV